MAEAYAHPPEHLYSLRSRFRCNVLFIALLPFRQPVWLPDLPPDCAALLIRQVAKAYHLEPALLHAVICAESAYNEQAG